MKSVLIGFIGLVLLILPFQAVQAADHYTAAASIVVPPRPSEVDTGYEPEAYRRGGYRSPRMGYTPGNRARNPAVNNPRPRTPAAPARPGGFAGGLFGGLLAGSLIGSLLNPFGLFPGGGISILGLLFWGVILYLIFWFIRLAAGNRRR